MSTITRHYVSLGQAAAILQAGPEAIRRAAVTAGVRPVLTLNGVPHFDESDLPAIRRQLKTTTK